MKNILFSIVIAVLTCSTALRAEEISPLTVDGATTVSTKQARALFDEGILFIDARKTSDWDAGRVPSALHLNVEGQSFTESNILKEITKDEKVVIYCNGDNCMRSSTGAKLMVSWGFKHVYYFRDGFPAWKLAGNPIE